MRSPSRQQRLTGSPRRRPTATATSWWALTAAAEPPPGEAQQHNADAFLAALAPTDAATGEAAGRQTGTGADAAWAQALGGDPAGG